MGLIEAYNRGDLFILYKIKAVEVRKFKSYKYIERFFEAMLVFASTAWKGVIMAVEEIKNPVQADIGKRTYSVQEIADILQISRSMAYSLCQRPPFKVVRVGKYVRVSKPSFDAWLDSTK